MWPCRIRAKHKGIGEKKQKFSFFASEEYKVGEQSQSFYPESENHRLMRNKDE